MAPSIQLWDAGGPDRPHLSPPLARRHFRRRRCATRRLPELGLETHGRGNEKTPSVFWALQGLRPGPCWGVREKGSRPRVARPPQPGDTKEGAAAAEGPVSGHTQTPGPAALPRPQGAGCTPCPQSPQPRLFGPSEGLLIRIPRGGGCPTPIRGFGQTRAWPPPRAAVTCAPWGRGGQPGAARAGPPWAPGPSWAGLWSSRRPGAGRGSRRREHPGRNAGSPRCGAQGWV